MPTKDASENVSCLSPLLHIFDIYSNKKERSDFHGIVSLDPVKMLQKK